MEQQQRCQSFKPGHTPHHIPVLRYVGKSENQVAATVSELAALPGGGARIQLQLADGSAIELWNHEYASLAEYVSGDDESVIFVPHCNYMLCSTTDERSRKVFSFSASETEATQPCVWSGGLYRLEIKK